jgi:transposase
MKKIKDYSSYEVRIRAVKAYKDGMSLTQVAKAYHMDRSTIYRWVKRDKLSPGGRGLQRKLNPGSGRPRKLEEVDTRMLRKIVLKPASAFDYETDFWTTTRLRQVFQREFRVKLSPQTIWRRLREAELTYQKPERRYFQSSEKDRREWIKTVLPQIRATAEKYKAILYCEDEANISLTPVLARTWAPRGKTPIQRGTGKRGGVAAISAISKTGRLIFRLLEKRINSDDIIDFLSQILKHHGKRHVVVVMDKASCHVSKKTKLFIESQKRLHVFHFPSYSPDWNPDEQVWNHLKNQEMKGHKATTKAEMKNIARRKLKKMQQDPQKLRGIFFRCCIADLLE